jgi:pSer/pThr/pTyr-binding forkhead associated (FHA) protein
MAIRIIASRIGGQAADEASRYEFQLAQEELLIGRSNAVALCLPDPAVSLVHGQILVQGDEMSYVDRDSTNGSRVDGRPAIPNQRVPISLGSRLTIGPFELVLAPPASGAETTSSRDTASYARQMVREAMQALGQRTGCELEVLTGSSAGQRTALKVGDLVVVGRGEECGLRLDDGEVSRRHAEVVCRPDEVVVVDLGSKNGIRVEGERVEGSRPLQHGEELELGDSRLRFHDPAAEVFARLQVPTPNEYEHNASSPAPSSAAAALQEVTSGELQAPPVSDRLSSASAFELSAPASVVPAGQAAEEEPADPSAGRAMDIALFVIGALLVVAGAAVIAYLLA